MPAHNLISTSHALLQFIITNGLNKKSKNHVKKLII